MTNKPIVVVSRCLGFAICRWNGAAIENRIIEDLGEQVNFITVCPELEIGLGVPREPILIVKKSIGLKLLQPATGADLTAKMISFCHAFLNSVDQVDGFLLKRKSPSCGLNNVPVYAGPNDEHSIDQVPGFFAQAVLKRFPETPVVDEAQLEDSILREKWLQAVFNRAQLRMVQHEL